MCGRDGASCRRTGRRSKKQIESKAGRETQHAAQRFTVVRHHYVLIAWPLSMACLCLGNGRSHQHYKVSHLALKNKVEKVKMHCASGTWKIQTEGSIFLKSICRCSNCAQQEGDNGKKQARWYPAFSGYPR